MFVHAVYMFVTWTSNFINFKRMMLCLGDNLGIYFVATLGFILYFTSNDHEFPLIQNTSSCWESMLLQRKNSDPPCVRTTWSTKTI